MQIKCEWMELGFKLSPVDFTAVGRSVNIWLVENNGLSAGQLKVQCSTLTDHWPEERTEVEQNSSVV